MSGLRPAFMLDYGIMAPEQLAATAASVCQAVQLPTAGLCIALLVDCCYLVRPQLLPDLTAHPQAGTTAAPAAAGTAAGAAAEAGDRAQAALLARNEADQQAGAAAPDAPMLVGFRSRHAIWAAGADAADAAVQLQALRHGLLHAAEQQHSTEGCITVCSTVPIVLAGDIPGWQQLVPPTASGYLLGYPAIYLCHSFDEAQAASRSLSSTSLHLHSVSCQLLAPGVPQPEGQPLLAFSLPGELADASEWEACRDSWCTRLKQRHREAIQRGVVWEEPQMAICSQPPRPVAL